MYQFEKCLPKDSEIAVWILQNYLLEKAERLIGTKDPDKKIFQPVFEDGGPFIRNRPLGDGAWAVLSRNAEGYWPTTLFELAHETIHLLNPIIGFTNYLEEGVAVAFSIDMSKNETVHPMSPNNQFYLKALELVSKLPDGVYGSAKRIRSKHGSLAKADPVGLIELFPSINPIVAEYLCADFKADDSVLT